MRARFNSRWHSPG